jgi:hypothetical protein
MLLAAAVSATGCATEGSSTAKQHEALPRAPTAGQELFADGFDSDANGWALPETAVGRMNFDDGDFVWESKVPNLRPHVIAETLGKQYDAGTLEMRDVVVIANVTIARGRAAAGVFCREVPDSDSEFQWYEFVVRDGFAAIRRSDSGGHIEVLARTDDAQLPIGKKAMITGICRDDAQGRGDLWLSLNGNTLLHYRDAKPLANGAPGIVAYDSPGKAAGDRFLIRWHDFAVHKAQDP